MKLLKKTIVLLFVIIVSYCVFFNLETKTYANANSIPKIELNTPTNKHSSPKTWLKEKTGVSLLNKILLEYRTVIVFVSGIGTLSMILFFIINLIALGNSKGNPQERQKAITGLVVTGIATAGLGSVTLISQLFYYMIK